MAVRRLSFGLGMFIIAFGAAPRELHAQETKKPAIRADSILDEFDVFTDGDWLLVPVKVNGKTYQFVLDTGCTCSVFDTSLGLGTPIKKPEIKTAFGAKKMIFYNAPAIFVGQIPWHSTEPIIGLNLSIFREISGHKIHGLIGVDFLKTMAVKIDFDRGKVSLLRSPAPRGEKTVPIIFIDSGQNTPFVVAEISGWGPELFLIDTGAVFGSAKLKKELFQYLVRKGLIKDFREVKSISQAGQQQAFEGLGKGLKFGPFLQPDLPVCESPFPLSLLGLGFLRQFNSTAQQTSSFPEKEV